MKLTWLIRATFLGAALFGAAACTSNSTPPGTETNWLEPCERDSECGGYSCWCGVCTSPCASGSSCSQEGATCSPIDGEAAGALCGGSSKLPSAGGLCLREGTTAPSVPVDSSSPVTSSDGSVMEAAVPGSASSDDAGNVEGGAQDSSLTDALSSSTPDAEATSTTTAPDGSTDACTGSATAPLGLEEVGSPCSAPLSCEDGGCPTSFTCGEATCGAPTSEYCSVVVSRQGVASHCAPLPTACVGDVSCECVTGEPPGLDCSIGTSGEVIVTLEAS